MPPFLDLYAAAQGRKGIIKLVGRDLDLVTEDITIFLVFIAFTTVKVSL